MVDAISSDRLAGALQSQGRASAREPVTASNPLLRFTVALAREAGTPGTAIARELGKRLDWPVYDHELLERIAQDLGVRASLLERVDEKHTGWLLESLESFLAVPMVSENAYLRHLIQIILALGAHGQCIIVGRGAAHILPSANTLRVRLIAPLHDRVLAIARQENLGEKDAERRVEAIDHDRNKFIRDATRKDPHDPHNYDLIVNCSRYSMGGCADLIADALRQAAAHAAQP
jgi:cytidylate kinase